MRTPASLFFLFVIASTRFVLAEEDEFTKFFNSPDGRFALKINVPKESADAKLEMIEKTSGQIVGDLGTDYASIISHIKVVWSADSKRLAFRTAGQKVWHTSVYFWNGSVFKNVPLPDELPSARDQIPQERRGRRGQKLWWGRRAGPLAEIRRPGAVESADGDGARQQPYLHGDRDHDDRLRRAGSCLSKVSHEIENAPRRVSSPR